ncbi:hypothetical protein CI102_12770 [Trichoderma harzianum]|nr:hypothetical protein CI102_12770 [Trichoderma harzianum]
MRGKALKEVLNRDASAENHCSIRIKHGTLTSLSSFVTFAGLAWFSFSGLRMIWSTHLLVKEKNLQNKKREQRAIRIASNSAPKAIHHFFRGERLCNPG